jgi:hypothetical protein
MTQAVLAIPPRGLRGLGTFVAATKAGAYPTRSHLSFHHQNDAVLTRALRRTEHSASTTAQRHPARELNNG